MMTSSVRCVACPWKAGSPEWSLGDHAVGRSREEHPEPIHLENPVGCIVAEDVDGILIGQVIATFDRVECVRSQRICLRKGCVDTSLGGSRVRPDWMHLGHEGDIA